LPANSASPKVSWAISGTSRLGVVQSDHNSRDLFRGSLEAERALLKKLRAEQFFGDEVVDSVL